MQSEKDYIISKLESQNQTVTVKFSRLNTNKPFLKNYNIKKFLDTTKFSFPYKIEKQIPKNTPPYVDNKECYFDSAARALALFKQCAFVGPSGTGKTHLTYLIAELAGLPIWEVNCGQDTSAADLIGGYEGPGRKNWVDGPVTSWCRYGGLLYLDEINMMKPNVATRLNPILDQRGHLVLTEKDSETIMRHQDAYLIMSMNPVSAEFDGTRPLNAATKRRMNVWINFDYMSVDSRIDSREIGLIVLLTGINLEIAIKIVLVGATLRELYYSAVLPSAPSVGDLTNWARLIKLGATFEKGANESIMHLVGEDVEGLQILRELIAIVNNDLLPIELENSNSNKQREPTANEDNQATTEYLLNVTTLLSRKTDIK